MVVKVQMNDKYEFLLSMDDCARALLHEICTIRGLDASAIISEIVLGGLTLQDHLFIHPDKSGM